MKNTNKYNKRVQSIRDDEEIIQLLPGVRIKVPNRHSTYGRVKVKTIQLFLGKYTELNKSGHGHSCDHVTAERIN